MSERKKTSNKRNALKSTGPKTPEGKKTVSVNAVKHGLRSFSPTVPEFESPEEWGEHRELILEDLGPVGYLEQSLAERVAVILWRLGRVVRYETLNVSTAIEEAAESVKEVNYNSVRFYESQSCRGAKDPGSLARLLDFVTMKEDKSPEELAEPVDSELSWGLIEAAAEALGVDLVIAELSLGEEVFYRVDFGEMPSEIEVNAWDGWTVDYLLGMLGQVATLAEVDFDKLEDETRDLLGIRADKIIEERQRAAVERSPEVRKQRLQRERLLLEETSLDKFSRYETTLERSLFRTLRELQRLQGVRTSGGIIPAAPSVNLHMDG